MSKRLPLVPTVLVAAAAATMAGLGVWQLDRARWKEGLLAQYEAARGMPEMAFPTAPLPEPLPLFRRASGHCLAVAGWRQVVGRSRAGEVGYAHLAQCRTGAEGPGMTVEAGWSKDPSARPRWTGGRVEGTIIFDRKARLRLVSIGGLGGLEPSAVPDVATASSVTPAGHRGYAATWFAFALLSVVIYLLALRGRWRKAAQ
jgi:surfeit locus 1 family protein